MSKIRFPRMRPGVRRLATIGAGLGVINAALFGPTPHNAQAAGTRHPNSAAGGEYCGWGQDAEQNSQGYYVLSAGDNAWMEDPLTPDDFANRKLSATESCAEDL